ncbi:GGDEF domain-containing protein [Parasphingorhabdus pacifica]
MRLADTLLAGHVPAQDRNVRILLDSARTREADVAFDELIAPGPNFVGSQWNRATVLVHRATLAWRLDRIALSIELAAEGWTELDLKNPSGTGAAHTTGMIGYLQALIGRRRTSQQFLCLSVDLARESNEQAALTHCLTRQASIVLIQAGGRRSPEAAREDFDTAHALFDEALSLSSHGQLRRTALAGLARAMAARDEPERALPLAQEAARLSVEAEDQFTGSLSNWAIASCHQRLGSIETARTYFSRALEGAENIHDALFLMRFSFDLADICRELRDPTGEAVALRRTVETSLSGVRTLQEGLGQALEQRRVAVQAQRLALAAQEVANRDSLTGLTNRRGLQQHAPALLDRTAAAGRVPWLLMVDVDQFKEINDLAGHTTGDSVLQEISRTLRNECRAGDLICRWAGDEFVVLLLDSVEEVSDAGPRAAERIRAAVEEHDWRILLPNLPEPTVSIGVAAGMVTFEHLFAAADLALYRAKREGRNRIEVDRTGPAEDRPTIA